MEYVRVYLKKFRKWLKINESFKVYKNRDMNEFFWYMCCLGGILRTPKVNVKLKILWLAFLIIFGVVIVSLNIYGLSNGKEIKISTILTFLRPISVLSTIGFVNLVFCYFYENLEKYVNEMDEYLSALPSHQNNKRYFHTVQLFEKFSLLLLCIIFWTKGFELFFPLLQEFENQSKMLNALTSVALAFIAFLSLAFIFGGQRLRYIFLTRMVYVFDDLQQEMRISSKSTLESLEMSHNEELAIEERDLEERNRVVHLFEERRNRIYKNFEENIAYFSKKHGKIERIHLRMKTFFEFICSITVLRTFSFLIIFGSDIFQALYHPNLLNSWTVVAVLGLVVVIFDFNGHCIVGSAMSDVEEMIAFEAYSCPWYLLPKKSRKMVSLLMFQFQIPQRLRAFGMFRFNLSLVPDVLQLAYSYVSVLQILLERSK